MTAAPAAVARTLAACRERIAAACRAAGRDPAAVQLLAVSKTHPAAAVRAAFAVMSFIVAAMAYAGKYHTDGWITVRTIAHEGGISTQKARKLVAVGLVHESGHTC